MNIVLEITGLQATRDKLRALSLNLNRLPNSMRGIGEYLASFYENEVFASRGQAIDANWPDLKPATWAAKARSSSKAGQVINRTAFSILVASGAMQKGFRYEANDTEVRVYNTQDYARYHQEGTVHIPQRKIMGLSMANRKNIVDIIRSDVKTIVGNSL